MRFVIAVHQWLYVRSRGWIGLRALFGLPSLLLTTTGRRSGLARTRALVYAEHGGELGVVASNGGADRHPAWLLNLQADPAVTVQRGRDRGDYTARIVEGEEREAWWGRCDAVNGDRYTGYQAATDRRIPVVVLTPAGDGGG